MSRNVVIRIADVDDELVLPADDFMVNDETGELTVYRFFADPAGSPKYQLRVWGQFSSYIYAYMEDDGEVDEASIFEAYDQLYGSIDPEAEGEEDESEEDEGDEDLEDDEELGDEDEQEEEEDDGTEPNGHDSLAASGVLVEVALPVEDVSPNSVHTGASAG